MVAHHRPMHLAKRSDPLGAPTGVAGIDNSVTVVNTAAAAGATSLEFDTSATPSSISAPPLDITNSNSPLVASTSAPVASSSSPSEAPTALAATSTKPIAISTVVGTCVGAFIGASGLIIIGLMIYRRYSQSLKKRSRARNPLNRNAQGDQQRRSSRLEPWNKLEEDDDKWEDMYKSKETKEVDPVAPMEKLTMFKKTASVRTAYTHKSADVSAFDFPKSYAEFDPSLAETLSAGNGKIVVPKPQPFLAQVDVNTDMAWETQTAGTDSYLSARQLSGAISPTLHMAIPTPPPIVSPTHVWESAEVIHYAEAQSAETVNPFDADSEGEQRQSVHNPFFNAQDYQPRSRSNSVTKSPKAKGKERQRYSNFTDPFDDMPESHLPIPKPAFAQHTATGSSSSTDSKERALQSLIAALEIPENEVRDRLRIASMQPSIISQTSSVGGYEEDVVRKFPLPPSGSETTSSHQP